MRSFLSLACDERVDVVVLGLVGARRTCRPLGRTITCEPTVNVAKRAMTNASPRSPAVTRPSGPIGGRGVVVRQEDGQARSRRGRCRRSTSPGRSSAASALRRRAPPAWGRARRATTVGSFVTSSLGAPASSQRSRVWYELARRLEPLAAGVRHGAGGLLEQQALGRDGEVDAPAADLAGEAVVVAVGVEAEQREAEAVLAAGRAVAAAGVAAGPHEDRHHVELEADRRLDRGLRDLDRDLDRLAAEGDRRARSRRRRPGGRSRRRGGRGPGWPGS